MALGCCEICDAQDVPGSRCGSDVCTDGFFCFLCQGDEFDPYREIDGYDGEGTVLVKTEPVTLDDLDETAAQQRDFFSAEAGPLASIVSLTLFCGTLAVWASILGHAA